MCTRELSICSFKRQLCTDSGCSPSLSVIRALPACHYQGTGDQLGPHRHGLWESAPDLLLDLGQKLNFNSFLCNLRQANHLLGGIGPNDILPGLLSGARAWLYMKVPVWLRVWHVIRTQCLLSFSLFYEHPRRIFLVLITDPRSIFVSSLGAMMIKLSFHLYRTDTSRLQWLRCSLWWGRKHRAIGCTLWVRNTIWGL